MTQLSAFTSLSFKTRLITGGTLLGVALLAMSWPLVQRVPNGSDHYFMIDVGEVQIVLNNWGTLHPTGYPHYTVLGNLFTAPLTALGVSPLVGAALFSLLWGVVALGLLLALGVVITRCPLLTAGALLAYALTRTVWIHIVIAEIYTFGLALLAGLLLLALWPGRVPGGPYARIYGLALLGGIGVAHHRAVGMVAPALIYAVWGDLTQPPRRLPAVMLKSLGLGLLGFVPYLYLMARGRAGAAWVYGEPGTWAGLWAEVSAAEYDRYIGTPDTWAGLWNNLSIVNRVLLTDVTLAGLLLGGAGLLLALFHARYRRAAGTLLLSGGVAYAFHAIYYTDVLSALILPVTLSLVMGWLLLVVMVLDVLRPGMGGPTRWLAPTLPFKTAGAHTLVRPIVGVVGGMVIAAFYAVLIARNAPFIHQQVTHPGGQQAIALAADAPDGSTLMMPWGPLHFAIGYAADIAGTLPALTLVDHNADYSTAFAAGALVVPEYIRDGYGRAWWQSRLGAEVYPRTAAPGLVALLPSAPTTDNPPDNVTATAQHHCNGENIRLTVEWVAPAAPLPDLSLFVHLLDVDGALIAQDDHPPAHGWHPTSAWQPGEIITERHMLPHLPAAATIRFGLYKTTAAGEFDNVYVDEQAVACGK